MNSGYGDVRYMVYIRVFLFGLFLRCTDLTDP